MLPGSLGFLALGLCVFVAHPAFAQDAGDTWFEPASPAEPDDSNEAAADPRATEVAEPPPAPTAAPAAGVAPGAPADENPPALPRKTAKEPAPPAEPKPEFLPYRRGEPVLPGYHVESYPRMGLLVPGLVLFTSGYGLAVLGATQSNSTSDLEDGYLLIPVFGPFLWIVDERADCQKRRSEDYCQDFGNTLGYAGFPMLILALQAPGAALTAAAFLSPKRELVRNERASFEILPVALPGRGHGIGARGRF